MSTATAEPKGKAPESKPVNPLDSRDPVARAEVGRNALERNLPQGHKRARPNKRFRVTCYDHAEKRDRVEEIEAQDANEAWAKFCDGWKKWPSPKASGRKVEELGPVE